MNNNDYPKWGDNEAYRKTIAKLGCTPKERYKHIAQTAAAYVNRDMKHNDFILNVKKLEDAFYDILWNGYLIPSTPVMFNFGTEKGLPISCFGSTVGDDMYEIGRKQTELMMLSKIGGGTSMDISHLRPIGSPIKNGLLGQSDGVIPFVKIMDSTILAAKQGNTRRGSIAVYLDIEHKESKEFMKIRDKGTDPNRVCDAIHHGFNIGDDFMNKVKSGDEEARKMFSELVITRVETGEPYIVYKDNARKGVPSWWDGLKMNNLPLTDYINHSNLCTEIFLPDSEDLTFVCCLSSLNLAKNND